MDGQSRRMSSWFRSRPQTTRKQRTLQKLREQRQPNFTGFTPSKAYIISGHGSEGTGVFRVPKDVVVVVKMQPHKTMIAKMAETLSEKVICSPEIYKDPLAHMDIVIKELGDVAVYREGDLCPNFQYSLWRDDSSKRSSTSTTVDSKSGLLDIDTQECSSGIEIEETTFNYSNDSIQNIDIQEKILDIFEDSVLPRPGVLASSFSGRFDTFGNWYHYYRDYLFSTTQAKLAENSPGVYYNFVCRSSKLSKQNAVNYVSQKLTEQEQKTLLEEIQTNPQMKALIQQYMNTNNSNEAERIRAEIGNATRSLTREKLGLSDTPYGERFLTKELAYSNFASAPLRNKKKVLLNRIAEAETIRKRAQYYAQHPENVEMHRLAKQANITRRLEKEAKLKGIWNRMAETAARKQQEKPKWYQFWRGKTIKQVRPLNTSVTPTSVKNWSIQSPKKPWYKFWGGKTRRRRT